ncbi:DUF748 domain-containing protein [Candidatus Binatia bacterium]|nr:DUF748 domain-containing protein [Candidatus Binatia bacterium]
MRRHPWLTGTALAITGLILLAYVVGFAVAEPLRREAERHMNAALVGYRVSIGGLRLNVLGLGVDLLDLRVVQTSHPKPPIADIRRFGASIQWWALLHGRVVGDLVIVEPKLLLDLAQAQAEVKDDRELTEHGWQDAVRSIYPLEINALEVRRGSVTYDDGSKIGPIHATDVHLLAQDIRNVASREGTFPSPLRIDATVFDSGEVGFDGSADFLAEPHAALRGELRLEALPLKPITPIADAWGVRIEGGTLSLDGTVATAVDDTDVHLSSVRIDGMRADYANAGEPGARGKRVAEKTVRTATDPEKAPKTAVRVDELRLVNAELGWIDETADPAYRLFLAKLGVTVRDFSNSTSAGKPGRADLDGSFMGSGRIRLRATFQPTDARTEFTSNLEITDVDMTTMNDLLRARGGFDVRSGRFSLFSEIGVKNGRVDGYVKPLFRDLDVYDRQQDADKNIFRQAYEGIVGGIGTLLENRPRDEVATRTDLSGRIEDPKTSTWEIVVGLIQNAFVRAILPGLDRETGRS